MPTTSSFFHACPLAAAMLTATDAHRGSPLHIALAARARTPTLHLMISPRNSRIVDDDGYAPIQVAVGHAADISIVQRLIDLWPDSVTKPLEYNRIVLHEALRAAADPAIIRLLMAVWPEGVACTHGGFDPLLCAMDGLCVGDDSILDEILTRWPHLIDRRGGCDLTPLHVALQHRCPDTWIRKILHLRPEALQLKDIIGRVPLFYAATFGVSDDMLLELLRMYPKGIQSTDRDGNIPLMAAFMYQRATPFVIDTLIKAWPESSAVINRFGVNALRLALDHRQPDDVVLELIRLCPSGAAVRSECPFTAQRNGKILLHCALEYGRSQAVIQALKSAWPEGGGRVTAVN